MKGQWTCPTCAYVSPGPRWVYPDCGAEIIPVVLTEPEDSPPPEYKIDRVKVGEFRKRMIEEREKM
jgi:hypothetical protein